MRWLLIDQLIECDAGRRATAVKTFPRSDPFFADHFPGHPIVPGVLQIEMIAQTASRSLRLARPDDQPVLGAVRSARFIRPIRPGDRCLISAEIAVLRDHYAVERGTIEVEGVTMCEVELLMAFVPRARPAEPDAVLDDWRDHQGTGHELSTVGTGAHALGR